MSSIPSVLEDAWSKVQPSLTGIREALASQELPHPRIIRVGQLDSELLDQELVHLLQEPVIKALSFVNVSFYYYLDSLNTWKSFFHWQQATFRARFEAELHLLIQLTLYKLSIWNTGATYGAKLQDLRYVVSGGSSKRLSCTSLLPNHP
jgi:peroxin-2